MSATAETPCPCNGCELRRRLPGVVKEGVEALAPFVALDFRPLPLTLEGLDAIIEYERERATTGLATADWLAARTKRPEDARPVIAPIAKFCVALHLRHVLSTAETSDGQ